MNPYHGYKALLNQRVKIVDRIRNLDPNLAQGLAEIRLDWYRIRNAAPAEDGTVDTTEVLIYDEIGGICGVNAEQFVNELSLIDTPNIDVRINSPGGSLFDGIAIYNALVKHPSHITTYVDALAASAASIIAMGGDECVMMVGSQMMIHDALGVEVGNANDFRAMAEFLDRQSANIATIYAHKSSQNDADGWRALMLAETWMFAEEAVTCGLADSVYVRPGNAPTPSEDDEPDEDETDDALDVDAEFEILMRARHAPRADWKYKGGRRQAGAPQLKHSTEIEKETETKFEKNFNGFSDLISW